MSVTIDERASRQRARTAACVEKAIRQLIDEGVRISYYTVAERAQVARSTLYRREDLSRMINEARERTKRMTPSSRSADLQHEVERLNKKIDRLSSQIATTSYHLVSL